MPAPIRTALILLLSGSLGSAIAQTKEDIERQSQLPIAAFRCALLATDAEKEKRFFALGLKSGRDFIENMEKNHESFSKFGDKIPMIWRLSSGPTVDFILGRLYTKLEEVSFKEFEKYWTNETLLKIFKEDLYREQNCAFLL